MTTSMRRREFVGGLGAAAVWTVGARGQQPERKRLIGVLMTLAADDQESISRLAAFHQGLQELGWTIGRNVQIQYRWCAGDPELYRRYAEELVRLTPDVILALGSPIVAALQQRSRTIPIVFVQVTDPVGGGFIASLARPGRNATGFTSFEYGISVKWLELLKQIAPGVTRVAVIRDPTVAAEIGQLGAIQGVAPSLNVDLIPVDVRDPVEMEHAIAAFARGSNGGLIVVASPLATLNRAKIIGLAARYQIPAVYPVRYFVAEGGLISYGSDPIDQFRRAAGYVDRILRGERPADLAVQNPTRFETVLNINTAKALHLEVPATVLVRADEVIE